MCCKLSKDGYFVFIYDEFEEDETNVAQVMTRPQFIKIYGVDALPRPDDIVGSIVNENYIPQDRLREADRERDMYYSALLRLISSWKLSWATIDSCLYFLNYWTRRVGLKELSKPEMNQLASNIMCERYRKSLKYRAKKYSDKKVLVSVREMMYEITTSYQKKGIPF